MGILCGSLVFSETFFAILIMGDTIAYFIHAGKILLSKGSPLNNFLKTLKELPLPVFPEKHNAEGGKQGHAHDNPEGYRTMLQRYPNVHGKNAHHQRRDHDADDDDVEGLHEDIEVVAHDGYPGIHEACQDVRVDFGLAETLVVLDQDVIEEFHLIRRKADLGNVVLELIDDHAVGVDGVEVIDQALLQSKQADEVPVFHGFVDLLFQLVGQDVDDLQVFHKMVGRPVEHPEEEARQGLHPAELFAFKKRNVLRNDEHELVLEEKRTCGNHPEEELVLGRITFRHLEDQGNMIRFELETRNLIRVKGGMQGMFIHLKIFNKIALFIQIRIDKNLNRARIFRCPGNPIITELKSSQHTFPPFSTLFCMIVQLSRKDNTNLIDNPARSSSPWLGHDDPGQGKVSYTYYYAHHYP
jgi:hypothetical protein